MTNKIVIIGAGSTNFGLGLVGDFFKSKILSGSTLVLHDINSDTLKNTHKIANDYKEKLGVNFKIVSTTSRAEALQEANFCNRMDSAHIWSFYQFFTRQRCFGN